MSPPLLSTIPEDVSSSERSGEDSTNQQLILLYPHESAWLCHSGLSLWFPNYHTRGTQAHPSLPRKQKLCSSWSERECCKVAISQDHGFIKDTQTLFTFSGLGNLFPSPLMSHFCPSQAWEPCVLE